MILFLALLAERRKKKKSLIFVALRLNCSHKNNQKHLTLKNIYIYIYIIEKL